MTRGQVHVYTGDGKGKTTAAFGLAVRALCAGKNVYIGQFVKSMAYNETKIARLFDGTDSAWGRVAHRAVRPRLFHRPAAGGGRCRSWPGRG